MKEITLKLYTYEELSKGAQEHALAEHNKDNYDPYLQSHLKNLVKEELDESKIKYGTDSVNVLYSLGYSQGDGLMFEGTLYDDKDRTITIKHSGHYYHSLSRTIDYPEASERDYANFEEVYTDICNKIEQAGYAAIRYNESEEAFINMCESNEFTFEEDGTMRNA